MIICFSMCGWLNARNNAQCPQNRTLTDTNQLTRWELPSDSSIQSAAPEYLNIRADRLGLGV